MAERRLLTDVAPGEEKARPNLMWAVEPPQKFVPDADIQEANKPVVRQIEERGERLREQGRR